MLSPDRFAVVAGNGPSLARISPGMVLNDDFIIRTNNFFFETSYLLGNRIDLAVMGGDPRVSPFMFETLYQCRSDYELSSWTGRSPKVITAGKRRFSELFQPFPTGEADFEAEIQHIVQRFGKQPTTGTYAILAAYNLGAKRIIMVGMDAYSDDKRYVYQTGQHQRSLLGSDLNHRQIDTRLHDLALDRAILSRLKAQGDVELSCVEHNPLFEGIAQVAAPRSSVSIVHPRKSAPKDWVSRVGFYPIGLLKALRRASAIIRSAKSWWA